MAGGDNTKNTDKILREPHTKMQSAHKNTERTQKYRAHTKIQSAHKNTEPHSKSDAFRLCVILREPLYGVASISRLLKITGLFCKRALFRRRYSAKETCHFKQPTNRSHPIHKNTDTILREPIMRHHRHTHTYTHTHTHTYTHTHTPCAVKSHSPAALARFCLYFPTYGVASISRLLKIIGLFCTRALQKRLYSAKETYNFEEPTNRSHPIPRSVLLLQCVTSFCYVEKHRSGILDFAKIQQCELPILTFLT